MATSSNNDHNQSLVTNPTPTSLFDVSYKFPFIACDTSGLAWIRTGDTRIQLMDRQGTVKTTVNTNFGFNDMAISPTGDLLLSDIKNNRIKSVSRNWTIRTLLMGRIRTLFSTEWSPGSLCCLDDGDIVVTFIADKKIVRYSSEGDVRQRFWDVWGQPFRISRSKVNRVMYTTENDTDKTPNTSLRLAVLNGDGSLRYRVVGAFTPIDVCTDQQGHVIVTNTAFKCVHVLDKDANLLQYIPTSGPPLFIDVDRDGYMWVGMQNGKIEIIKYLQ